MSYIPSSNLIASQTDAAGNTTHFSYYGSMEHGAGQIKSIENALGQMSYPAYDALGRPTHTWGDTDYPQAYTYTTAGQLATRNPGNATVPGCRCRLYLHRTRPSPHHYRRQQKGSVQDTMIFY